MNRYSVLLINNSYFFYFYFFRSQIMDLGHLMKTKLKISVHHVELKGQCLLAHHTTTLEPQQLTWAFLAKASATVLQRRLTETKSTN